jgi:hypothetical protein
MVAIATELIMDRHKKLFDETKGETDALVDYIKSTVRPISIIATSIIEFRLTPSIVEIAPVPNRKPIAHSSKAGPWSAFFLVFFIMAVVSFYLESALDATQGKS